MGLVITSLEYTPWTEVGQVHKQAIVCCYLFNSLIDLFIERLMNDGAPGFAQVKHIKQASHIHCVHSFQWDDAGSYPVRTSPTKIGCARHWNIPLRVMTQNGNCIKIKLCAISGLKGFFSCLAAVAAFIIFTWLLLRRERDSPAVPYQLGILLKGLTFQTKIAGLSISQDNRQLISLKHLPFIER